jgi:hypothetical protein
MTMQRASILVGKCYQDTFGAIYRIEGYDGNEVRYVVYHVNDRGMLVERQNSETWSNFLEDLLREVDCPL